MLLPERENAFSPRVVDEHLDLIDLQESIGAEIEKPPIAMRTVRAHVVVDPRLMIRWDIDDDSRVHP